MGRLNLLGGQINLPGGQMPTQLTCYLPPWNKGKQNKQWTHLWPLKDVIKTIKRAQQACLWTFEMNFTCHAWLHVQVNFTKTGKCVLINYVC